MAYRFGHRFARQRYVIKSMRPIYANDGSGRIIDNEPGQEVQFEGHEFVTEDKAVADWLRAQPGFGTEITEVAPGDIIPSRVAKPEVAETLNTGAVRTGKEEYRCYNCGKVQGNKLAWQNHVPACIKKSREAAKAAGKESTQGDGAPAPEQPADPAPAPVDTAPPQ